MRQKPRLLTVISVLFVMAAISMPLQVMYHLDSSLSSTIYYLSDINILLALILFTSGVCTFFCTKHVKYLLLSTLFFIILNNQHVTKFGVFHQSLIPYISSIIAFGLMAIFSKTKAFKVLTNQKLQWWKPAKRYKVSLRARIIINGKEMLAKTYDISKTGLYISTSQIKAAKALKNAVVKVELILPSNQICTCQAKVVRISEIVKGSPIGLGLQLKRKDSVFESLLKTGDLAY